MSKTKNQEQKSIEDLKKEIKSLSEAANAQNDIQLDLLSELTIGEDDIEAELDLITKNEYANPQASHQLYYGIRSILVSNLPKGITNKKLRKYITNEINLFLNNGNHIKKDGTRGSDGKMAYIHPILLEAFTRVSEWKVNGANYYDLYQIFRDMNEERGYYN
jgi:3-oxoacyl-ACP reductase-like protein